jgi:hypothetical protein
VQLRFALIVLLIVWVFCPARGAQLSAKESAEARKLYIAKCARCHKFYDPSAYSEGEWIWWMSKMRKKARLKSEQYDLLLRYTEGLRVKGGNSSGPVAKN